ncbi:MAG: twin-arginine translocase subunit TatC [Bacteroidia bacterium]|nr:twin-arginine translocase subunit TatC [Bacteroidia bacterium]MDW8301574.1 twin-arginine translocase subunit TatC [Bacteroidia bacterium]
MGWFRKKKTQFDDEMSFLEHLEELRWAIIRGLIGWVIFTIAAFAMKNYIFGYIIFAPKKQTFLTYQILRKIGVSYAAPDFPLVSTTLTGQFTSHLLVSIYVGFILGFPFIFWQLWQFVKPGLYPHEIKATRGVVGYATFLFIAGLLFGYFIITPVSLSFLVQYSVDDAHTVKNMFHLGDYISVVALLTFAFGLIFQMPLIIYFLAKVGIMTPPFMRHYRKHAILGIFILSALITPTTDMITQLIVAIPMLLLYEVSILIAGRVQKQREQAEKNVALSTSTAS